MTYVIITSSLDLSVGSVLVFSAPAPVCGRPTSTVKIVGVDAGHDQVAQLKEGTVQALVAQQPALIGQYGVDAAVAALDGTSVPKSVQTGFTVITKDNIDGDGKQYVYKSAC